MLSVTFDGELPTVNSCQNLSVVKTKKKTTRFYAGEQLQTAISAEQAVAASSSSSVVFNGGVQQFLSRRQGSRLVALFGTRQ